MLPLSVSSAFSFTQQDFLVGFALQQHPSLAFLSQHELPQQQDLPDLAEVKETQNSLVLPFGHRQTTCGTEPSSVEAAVAQTIRTTAILRKRRMIHHLNYKWCSRVSKVNVLETWCVAYHSFIANLQASI